ncbi:MAG: 4'-phosphopantetheinyl transferase superfamily protein [Candidatus Cloacimonetes bacterium]|nr:4'-phosphopantetheinyl transferase superfamily protein [Candidatus Cloacimonadota bacterium]
MFSQLIHRSVDYDNDPIDYKYFEKLGQSLPLGSETWAAKRKRDYLAGRYCANECLSQVALQGFEIRSNADRSPIWPSEYCGSITHTKTYACCVLTSVNQYRSVGIDSEHKIIETTFKRVKRQIASDKEFDLVKSFIEDDCLALTIIFSCKEAIFKAIYPLVKKHFYFDAFEITHVQDSYLLGKLLIDLDSSFCKGTCLKMKFRVIEDRVDALVTIKNS